MRFFFLVSLLSMLCACASYKSDVYTAHIADRDAISSLDGKWFVKLDYDKPVVIRGVPADGPAETGAMVYSGDAGLVGFIAQIAAHSAVSSSIQEGQLSENQEAANATLGPLYQKLQGFNQDALAHDSERYQFINNGAIASGVTLESSPIFYVSQDSTCVSLKHLIKVYDHDEQNILYQNMIDVTSIPVRGVDPLGMMGAEDGMLIKNITSELYKQSLRLALTDMMGEFNTLEKKQKSYKFHQGQLLRVERGINLGTEEGTTVIRNLRGWLVAFPEDVDTGHVPVGEI